MKNIFKSLMVCSMLCGGVMSVFGVRLGFGDDGDAVSDGALEVSKAIRESVNVDKNILEILKEIRENVEQVKALAGEVKRVPAEVRAVDRVMMLGEIGRIMGQVDVLENVIGERMTDGYSELMRECEEILGGERGKKCEEDAVDNDKE